MWQTVDNFSAWYRLCFVRAGRLFSLSADRRLSTVCRIQALVMRCFCKLLGILYRDHTTNEEVKAKLKMPSGHMKTSWLQWNDANWSGVGTSHDHLDWPKLSYREQFKERDEEADRGNDGKTTSKSGLALNGISYYEKPRTARSGESWL